MPLYVCDHECDQCLFSKHKIVSATRKRQLLAECLATGSYFICHKATIVGRTVVCRGYYDRFGWRSNLIRIAQRLRQLVFTDPETLEKGDNETSETL